jgi:cathepsin L
MLFTTLLLTNVISQELYNHQFQDFIKKYNKSYETDSEYWYRYGIFKKNYIIIDNHNNNTNNNFTLRMNYFGDYDNLEYAHIKGYYNLGQKNITFNPLRHKMSYPVPDAIDWRAENLVTPIKNQGQCGSCWAFSTTGVIEGVHAKQTGNLVSLSEQQLVDCSQGNYGCGGGWPSLALENVIKRGGIDSEKSYPYQGDDESCSYNKSNIGAIIKSVVNITKYNMTELVNAIGTIGPISVAIDASDPAFQFYSGGIYTSKVCSPDNLDHAVLAIGYGFTSNKSKYFIIKNSWGMDWGEEGFMYFNRDIDNMCGIVMDAVYAQ